MSANGTPIDATELTAAISAAMVERYAAFHTHGRTTATTYINRGAARSCCERCRSCATEPSIARDDTFVSALRAYFDRRS